MCTSALPCTLLGSGAVVATVIVVCCDSRRENLLAAMCMYDCCDESRGRVYLGSCALTGCVLVYRALSSSIIKVFCCDSRCSPDLAAHVPTSENVF